jgi:hypothetical protein
MQSQLLRKAAAELVTSAQPQIDRFEAAGSMLV